MHPKNPFAKDYDFESLVKKHTPLEEHVFVNDYGTKTIKFSNNLAVRALNTALLMDQYDINYWEIPEFSLCPPIPGRLDYLLYVNDLVGKKEVKLLDIGTGSSLIYPILATCHYGWKCTASEIDKNSISNAETIIDKNPILAGTTVRHQRFKENILTGVIDSNDRYDVIVSNPPFFRSALEAEQQNKRKVHNLKLKEKETRNFGGHTTELWYKGGEEAFIKKMLLESIHFKEQVQWFTSLVSRKDSIKTLEKAAYNISPKEFKVVEMGQGMKKSRFVAWTF
ncbi:MAG: 23S rRNA (adenine1618-N6)-methyltransferase [Sphingobacteriales bacterium]|jgi:23S rRNA (adenine1618-N6)-methyltransferase